MSEPEKDFLNGPRLVEWIAGQIGEVPGRISGELIRQQVYQWRAGRQATVWGADEVLTPLGLHIGLIPDDIWEVAKERAPKPPGTRELALRLLAEGRTNMQVARSVGCSPRTISRWKAAANVE